MACEQCRNVAVDGPTQEQQYVDPFELEPAPRYYTCPVCQQRHACIAIDDSTVVKEFSTNYYIPNGKCAYWDEDRYCVLVSWEEFARTPELQIEAAFLKRDQPIANKVKVYPK